MIFVSPPFFFQLPLFAFFYVSCFSFCNHFQEPALIRRVQRLCDTVIKLESFVGSEMETNPVYKDYHGNFYNRPFAASDHVVQNRPCWRASSLLFPHWDIKTKRPEPVKLDLPLF